MVEYVHPRLTAKMEPLAATAVPTAAAAGKPSLTDR
jgi:hypothetical protein